MSDKKFDAAIERILTRDQRYHRDGYAFVEHALIYTQQKLGVTAQKRRHITGQELLEGIREYALREFASMTAFVFAEWGITRCEDIGEMLFNMVEERILSKTAKDSKTDFVGGFDFDEAFNEPFLPPSKREKGCKPLSTNS